MTHAKASMVLWPSDAEIRRQLGRILDYPELQSNARRQAMLRYIVEETLAGRSSNLKATTIAMDVFGRGADFDQQMDPIVRLEARKLRRDLDNYYAGAGRNDPIRISIPKGRYLPKFTQQFTSGTFEEAWQESGTIDTSEDASASRGAGAILNESTPPLDTTARPAKLRLSALVAALTVCAALLFIYAFWQQERVIEASEPPTDGARVLVEGFEMRGDDELVRLIAAGMSQEIVAYLLKFPDLRVHLSTSDSIADSNQSERARLRSLTHYVLNGLVWRENDDLLIRSELVRTEDGQVLWTQRYSVGVREAGITSIKDQIASQVASAVGQQYGVIRSELNELLISMETNPSLTSYACVARAQIYRRNLRPEQYPKARECLEETVNNHPEYARAWAMLAYLRNDAVRFGYEKDLPSDEALVPAREAASRALSFDPFDTDALKAMSHIEHYDGNFKRAIDYARYAVEANPNDPETIGNLGFMLGMRGRFDEAVPFLERAIERSVSPAPRYYQMLTVHHLMKSEWNEMLSSAYLAVADDSAVSHSFLAIAHAALGNESAALNSWKKMEERWPLLAEDPRAAYSVHKLHPAITDALVAGLSKVAPSLE